jgi:hypothetical protein
MDLSAGFSTDSDITVNAGANIQITSGGAGSVLTGSSNIVITGANAVLDFAKVSVDGTFSADTNGLGIIRSWPNNGINNGDFTTKTGGTIAFGSGQFKGTFSADGGVMAVLPSSTFECKSCTINLDDSDLLINGTFNYRSGSINGENGGEIIVNSDGTFETIGGDSDMVLDDKLSLSGEGSVIFGGDIEIKESGSITLNGPGSSLHIRSSSGVDIKDNGKISVTEGKIDFDKNINFEGDSVLEIDDLSQFYFKILLKM